MHTDLLPHHHGEEEHHNIDQIRAQLAKADNFQIVADIFKQVGDPTRVRIFWLLCHCEECVQNISALMEMSSPAVSHHLRGLKAVSYTHLDVYKRQRCSLPSGRTIRLAAALARCTS